MKKALILTIVLFTAGPILAQNPGPEEIISKYLEAAGIEKLMEIKTMIFKGSMNQQGMDMSMTVHQKQPRKNRMEIEFQGMKIIMAVSGDKGWTVNPMMGSMEPQDLPEESVKEMLGEDGMDPTLSWTNMFLSWKEDGKEINLVGKEEIDGRSAYNLEVIFENEKIVNYLIDTQNYDLLLMKTDINMQGQQLESNTRFDEYFDKEGVRVPGKIIISYGEQEAQDLTLNSVEFNTPIDDAIFLKPAVEESE